MTKSRVSKIETKMADDDDVDVDVDVDVDDDAARPIVKIDDAAAIALDSNGEAVMMLLLLWVVVVVVVVVVVGKRMMTKTMTIVKWAMETHMWNYTMKKKKTKKKSL
jgi:hypothetical protein